jgi:hypothetical protein
MDNVARMILEASDLVELCPNLVYEAFDLSGLGLI